jgi:hypothetical protein
MAVLLLHAAWRVGPTYDEHFYVAAGNHYWRSGDFALNREHPPLLKLLAGLPLVLAPGVVEPPHAGELLSYPVAFFHQHNGAQLDRNLFLARLPFCALALVCAVAVARAAAQRYGPRAGVLGLALFAFNPGVLAHGPLAALDLGVAALMFFAVLAYARLAERPSWRAAWWAALAFGLANLAKSTALVLMPLFAGLALWSALRTRRLAPLGWCALVFAGGLSLFAAGYGFEAKSVYAAWGEPEYVSEMRAPPPAPSPTELAHAAQRAGASAAACERIAAAPDGAAAADALCTFALQADAELARAALRALERLRRAPGELRKRCFERVLFGASLADDARLRCLSALADLDLRDEASAQAWWQRTRAESWDRAVFTQGWIRSLTHALVPDDRPLPLFSSWKGLDYQFQHASYGHGSYFRGQVLQAGVDFERGNPHPEYYALVFAVKNPLAFLALVALGLALCWRKVPGHGALDRAALVGTPLVLFALFSTGNALLGIKYLLPVLPFACVLAARSAQLWPRAALALGALAVAESVWIHPDHLMYFNAAAGGPSGGPRITVMGDDWGQGVRELGRYAQAHARELEAAGGLHCTPYTTGDRAAFGLDAARPLSGPVQGIVAVHLVQLLRNPAEHAWLAGYEPYATLARSVQLYDTRVAAPGGRPPELGARP